MIECSGCGWAPVPAVTAIVRVVGVLVAIACDGSGRPRGCVHAIDQVAGVVREKEISRTINCHTTRVRIGHGSNHMRGGIHTPNLAYPAFSLRNKEVSRTVDR